MDELTWFELECQLESWIQDEYTEEPEGWMSAIGFDDTNEFSELAFN